MLTLNSVDIFDTETLKVKKCQQVLFHFKLYIFGAFHQIMGLVLFEYFTVCITNFFAH